MAENLEQELVKLEQEYAQKRAEIESREQTGEVQEAPPEKETVREVVREQIDAAPTPAPPAQAAPPSDDTLSYQRQDLQAHVQELINLAFEKSIKEAIDKVKATHNPALIDAFHDALVDNLYNELVERGQIKELTSS